MSNTLRSLRAIGLTVAFLLVVVLAAGTDTPPAAAQGPTGQLVGEPVTAVRTGVVNFAQIAADSAKSPKRPTTRRVVPSRRFPGQRPSGVGSPILPGLAPAPAPARTSSTSPLPASSFAGLDDDGTAIPPDTTGAVGLTALMETLNNNIQIQDRGGGTISTLALFDFWNAPPSVLPPGTDLGSGPFDPSVIYDPFGGRFIHSVASNDSSAQSSVCIAVSQTSDPTGNWNRFCFDVDGTDTLTADFPRLGFNKDWIVVSMNMFAIGGGYVRGQIYAFNKANLYNNINSGHFVFPPTGGVTDTHFTMIPAVTLDNALAIEYLVRQPDDCATCSTITKSALVGSPPSTPVLHIDTAIVTSNLSSWSAFPSTGNFLPQAPPSTGTGNLGIESNDDGMLDAMVRTVDGVTSIWASQTIFLPSGSPTHAAAQWWQVDAGTSSSSTLIQQGRVEDPTATTSNGGKHFAYPSIAVNKFGDMLIGYSRFSSSSFASAAYSYRQAGDPANTTRDDVTLRAGLAYYEETFGRGVNRWGDFSNTVIDPLSDTDLWTIQEYAKNLVGTPSPGTDTGQWGTWWGRVFPGEIVYFPEISKSP